MACCGRQLLVQGVSVVRVSGEGARAHDQVALERADHAHLDAELVGLAGLALGDAFDFRRMPGVELGLAIDRLALAALGCDARSLGQGAIQRLAHGLPDGTDLGLKIPLDLALQPAPDGALALDGAAHAPPLPGVRVAASLTAELFALLGEGLFQIETSALSRLHELGARSLQQPAVGGVGDGLLLHRGVHNHARELLRLDELQINGNVDGLSQQLLDAFFTEQLAEFNQGTGFAGALVLKVRPPREELPGRRLAPTLEHAFVGFVEGVLEVQQTDHHAQRHTRAPGVAGRGHTLRLLAKEVQIGQGLSRAALA